ncbi:uncharacterized protein MEPE_04651 [Melanopsichium pennsylvanicum]|uniref:Uncharacterized protein n=1 Tax=Melanopsichium pennsylvanicum TaxID=63383 RepID=A0AAJ4XPE0_9BASI|nr:uncharacterized protein MEPE_04651 [Melanopsichium pennsylvanicum]
MLLEKFNATTPHATEQDTAKCPVIARIRHRDGHQRKVARFGLLYAGGIRWPGFHLRAEFPTKGKTKQKSPMAMDRRFVPAIWRTMAAGSDAREAKRDERMCRLPRKRS